jgi:hypothetical protein
MKIFRIILALILVALFVVPTVPIQAAFENPVTFEDAYISHFDFTNRSSRSASDSNYQYFSSDNTINLCKPDFTSDLYGGSFLTIYCEDEVRGVVSDGTYLYIACANGWVEKLEIGTYPDLIPNAAEEIQVDSESANSSLVSMAFDGTYIYAVETNTVADKVYKIDSRDMTLSDTYTSEYLWAFTNCIYANGYLFVTMNESWTYDSELDEYTYYYPGPYDIDKIDVSTMENVAYYDSDIHMISNIISNGTSLYLAIDTGMYSDGNNYPMIYKLSQSSFNLEYNFEFSPPGNDYAPMSVNPFMFINGNSFFVQSSYYKSETQHLYGKIWKLDTDLSYIDSIQNTDASNDSLVGLNNSTIYTGHTGSIEHSGDATTTFYMLDHNLELVDDIPMLIPTSSETNFSISQISGSERTYYPVQITVDNPDYCTDVSGMDIRVTDSSYIPLPTMITSDRVVPIVSNIPADGAVNYKYLTGVTPLATSMPLTAGIGGSIQVDGAGDGLQFSYGENILAYNYEIDFEAYFNDLDNEYPVITDCDGVYSLEQDDTDSLILYAYENSGSYVAVDSHIHFSDYPDYLVALSREIYVIEDFPNNAAITSVNVVLDRTGTDNVGSITLNVRNSNTGTITQGLGTVTVSDLQNGIWSYLDLCNNPYINETGFTEDITLTLDYTGSLPNLSAIGVNGTQRHYAILMERWFYISGITPGLHHIELKAEGGYYTVYIDSVLKSSGTQCISGACSFNSVVNFYTNTYIPYYNYLKIRSGGSYPPVISSWLEPDSMIQNNAIYDESGHGNLGMIYWYNDDEGIDVSQNNPTTSTPVLWYQPNNIISGTTLPDRLGTQNGIITWGDFVYTSLPISDLNRWSKYVSGSSNVDYWKLMDAVPAAPGHLYTELGTGFLFGSFIETIHNESGIPLDLLVFPYAFGLSLLFGLLAYVLSMGQAGRDTAGRRPWKGSLPIMAITSGVVMIYFVIAGNGVIPGWTLIPFGVWAFASIIFRQNQENRGW